MKFFPILTVSLFVLSMFSCGEQETSEETNCPRFSGCPSGQSVHRNTDGCAIGCTRSQSDECLGFVSCPAGERIVYRAPDCPIGCERSPLLDDPNSVPNTTGNSRLDFVISNICQMSCMGGEEACLFNQMRLGKRLVDNCGLDTVDGYGDFLRCGTRNPPQCTHADACEETWQSYSNVKARECPGI